MKCTTNIFFTILALTSLVTTSFAGAGHHHGSHGHHEDHAGHDHEDHEEERVGESLTLFTDHSELFLKFPVLVRGMESKFQAHFTHLHNARPFMKGRVIVLLRSEDQADESFQVEKPVEDGVFTPTVIPKVVGKRKISLYLQGSERTEFFELGEYQVYATESDIPKKEEEEDEELISFLKEQQWKTEFGIQKIRRQSFAEKLQAPARVVAPNHATVSIKSPLAGKLAELKVKQFQNIKAGDQIAVVQANTEFNRNYFNLQSRLKLINVELEFHRAEVKRYTKLVNQQSASQTELLKSRLEVQKLEIQINELKEELSRLKNTYDLEVRQDSIYISINALQDGVAQVLNCNTGEWLEEQQELLQILRPQNLNLHIYLPLNYEPFKLTAVKARVLGTEHWLNGADVLSLNRSKWLAMVDPTSKHLTLSIPIKPGHKFQAGQSLEVELSKAQQLNGIELPLTVLSIEQGNSYVYVQVDGERYERRPVRTGYQMAQSIIIEEGLEENEWVVVKGAYNLRLAGSSDQVPAHGHAH